MFSDRRSNHHVIDQYILSHPLVHQHSATKINWLIKLQNFSLISCPKGFVQTYYFDVFLSHSHFCLFVFRLRELYLNRRWRPWTPIMWRLKKLEVSRTWKDVWLVQQLTSSSSAWKHAMRRYYTHWSKHQLCFTHIL